MAQPAAVLSVLVTANTKQATTGLMRLNTRLASTEGKTKTAAASMKAFGKTAALAGGVAGVGALAFGAKKAFGEFREAQKVTAQTRAVLKSTGNQAKVTAREIENLAEQISLKAGIDDEAIQSAENLLLTFTKVRNETGKGNDVFNQATQTITDMSVALDQDLKSSAIQVGKALQDPQKGITALRRVGVNFTQTQSDMIEKWVKHGKTLKAQKFILKELTTEFGGSAAAQADNADKLRVAWDNLFEQIGKAFGPAVEKGMGKLAKFVRQMQNGKGAGGEFVDTLEDIRDAAKDLGSVIGPPLKKIGEFVLDHPKVTAMAVAIGLLGKGLVGLRGGGTGKLGGIGRAIGAMKPVPVFVTNAGGLPGGGKGGGPKGAVGKVAEKAGTVALGAGGAALTAGATYAPIIGPAGGIVALAAVGWIATHMKLKPKDIKLINERTGAGAGGPGGRGKQPGAGITPGTVGDPRTLEASKKAYNSWSKGVENSLGHVQEAQQEHVAASRQAFQAAGDRLQNLRERTANITKHIRERFGTDTAKGRDALARNYRQAANAAKTQMDRTGVITTQGLKFIRELFIKEQMLYGATRQQANASFKQSQSDQTSHKPFRGSGAQRGGFINEGKPSGDSVPAVLERGEYVLNRKAVAKIGQRYLDAVNFKQAPRMQGGGIVGLGRQLQQQGFQVGEHPAFGGVGGSHVQGSYHYKGQALDVNWPDMGAEPGKLDKLYSRLKGMAGIVELLWRVAGHFDHLHVAMTGAGGALPGLDPPKIGPIEIVNGPQGALGNITASGLDAARRTANKQLAELFPGLEGAEAGRMGGNAALNMRIGKQLAARFGWGSGPQWGALVELWNRESGWDNMARNPSSGAFGIPQALPPDKMGAAAAGGNAEAQIRWGLNYIAGRYGTPSGALAFHDANNWYRSGGPVGMQFGGGARGPTYSPGTGFANPAFAGAFPAAGGKSGRPGSRLTRQMNRAVNVVGGLTKKGKRFPAKVRSRVLKRFLERVKGIGLPTHLESNLKKFEDAAAIFGDYAGRASQLSVTDAAGNEIPGVAGGLPETDWLAKQLEQLFKLRNALIRAREIFAEKRAAVVKLLARSQDRMGRLADQIRGQSKIKQRLEEQLKELKKHPNRNAKQIRTVKKGIKEIEEAQGVRVRERDTLKNRIVPVLSGQRGTLATGLTNTNEGLDRVQGIGSPMTRLATLPAVGALGGEIFDVQMRLRSMGQQETAITDTTADDSGRADLLAQLLREANLRTAVSQAQYGVFKNMQQFATGGVVQGTLGAPTSAVVHAGEGVFTRDQMAAMGGGWNGQIIINGDIINTPRGKKPVEIRDIRGTGRAPLPGGGGGWH